MVPSTYRWMPVLKRSRTVTPFGPPLVPVILAQVLLFGLCTERALAQESGPKTESPKTESPKAAALETASSRPASSNPLELPSLLALSREIARLRKSVDFVGQVRLRSRTTTASPRRHRFSLVHVGSGILVGPRDPDLEPGAIGVIRFQERLYRVRYLGVDRSFAGYYRLRDRDHVPPLAGPRFYDPKDRGKLGDLSLLVDGGSTRLQILSQWRYSLPSVPGRRGRGMGEQKEGQSTAATGKSARLESWRRIQFHKLSEGQQPEAAVVVALDGTLVGLVCTVATHRAPRLSSPGNDLQLVVDGRFLLRQGQLLESALKKLPAPTPTFGVSLSPAEARDADSKGFLVEEVVSGGPGERAGVKVGDRWLEIGGQALASFSQIRSVLQNLEAGTLLTIRYQRASGKAATLSIHPD